MVIISLCDRTGNMVKPWAEAGHECHCVDVQHSIRKPKTEGNITYHWGDARAWVPPSRPDILFAFPPCTNVSVSGARDFKTKGPRLLADALDLFNACQFAGEWAGCPYMIENPVGVLSSHVRKPDHTFQPWHYGDNYTKQTCLWVGNGFVMPKPQVTAVPEDVSEKIHKCPPSRDRGDIRSITPMGFARAVFESNHHKERN